MANILYYRIEFIGTLFDYVAGDVVELFHDNTIAFSVVVEKNGSPITSGSTIFTSLSHPSKIETFFNPQVCANTSLTIGTRIPVFPYMEIGYAFDHPSCPFTPGDPDPPIICDLIVVGVPSIIKASTDTAMDGSITVLAQSTRTIQYKLNSDFIYADGTGQTTGVFTGLAHGNYRIFMRDQANCSTNILVGLPVENVIDDAKEFYVCEFDDIIGGRGKVVILKRDYTGDPTEVCGTAEPFELLMRGEGEDNKFKSVFSTQANLHLVSETDFQFGDIYTNDPEKFRMNFYMDYNDGNGYVLAWRGKVLPKQYSEAYKAPPYYVTITATDGLPILADLQFLQDDGSLFYGTIKSIELLAFCLKKTGIELPIRVAINLYSTTMFQTAVDDPLDQAYTDFDAYYIAERKPTYKSVIEAILKPYGARLIQADGYWNVTRIEELKGNFDYRVFDKDGVYVSNSSLNPVVNINPPSIDEDLNWSDNDQFMELRQGYGKIRMIYKLGLADNILRNGDFRLKPVFDIATQKYKLVVDTFGFQLVNGGEVLNEGYEDLKEGNVAYLMEGDIFSIFDPLSNGESYLLSESYPFRMGSNNTIKITIRYKIPTPYDALFFPINIPYQKLRVIVKFGIYYLQSTGNWTTTYNEIVFYNNQFDKYIDAEIIATQPTATFATNENDFSVRVFHSYFAHSEYPSTTSLKTKVTVNLSEGTRTEAFTDPYVYFYTLQNNTSAENLPLIVRPNDYDGSTNPYQWVWTSVRAFQNSNLGKSSHWIDKIQVQFLDGGSLPIDTIIHEVAGEEFNKEILEYELIHGSYTELITTGIIFQNPNPLNIGPIGNIPQGPGAPPLSSGVPIEIVQSVLAGNLIYRGYLRDSSGEGFENWKRDGIAESTTLHGILARSIAFQYRSSFRKITGSLYGRTKYLKFINCLKEVFDDNRLYMPMALTIYAKSNKYNGEFLELMDISDGAGSTGGGDAPYSSGFTSGFGGGFN